MNWLDRWLLSQAVKRLEKQMEGKGMLSGYKAYLAGIGLILGALSMAIKMIQDGDFSNLNEAILMFGNGLGILGIRHAISKGPTP